MSTSTLVVPLAEPLPSVLAVGAWLKNTVCLIQKAQAQLSPCLGDLNSAEVCIAHETAVNEFLQKSAMSSPVAAVAHDLHPDFHSTRAALAFATERGLPAIAVQHHHAHIAAVMAETEVKARLYVQGMSPVVNSTADFTRQIDQELVRWAKVVAARKLQAN